MNCVLVVLPTSILCEQLNGDVKLPRIEDAHVHWELGVVWKKINN